MTLSEKAALLPDATTEELFNLILEMAHTIEVLANIINEEIDEGK